MPTGDGCQTQDVARDTDDDDRIESDLSPSRRRLRAAVFVGIPTVAACAVVLLLGMPVWIVGVFLVVFALMVIANS